MTLFSSVSFDFVVHLLMNPRKNFRLCHLSHVDLTENFLVSKSKGIEKVSVKLRRQKYEVVISIQLTFFKSSALSNWSFDVKLKPYLSRIQRFYYLNLKKSVMLQCFHESSIVVLKAPTYICLTNFNHQKPANSCVSKQFHQICICLTNFNNQKPANSSKVPPVFFPQFVV